MKHLLSAAICCVCLSAACNPNGAFTIDILAKACWECMLPLKLGGVTIMPGSMPDSSFVSQPVCVCSDPFPRVGLPISYYEPSRIVEVVSNPWCFPTLGFSAGGGIELRGTSTEVGDRGRTFYQAHYMIFPLMEWLDILMNGLCLESAGFDMAYITEVDPLWQDDILTAMINPEALLFGNPVSHIACVADSLAAQANAPLDPLFWCKGSWGNAYPLTGNVATHGLVEDAASVAASLIYKLHRELILWGSYGAEGLCGTYPAPIWRKSAYRLQIVSPIAHPTGMGIGQSGIIWGMGKNPPFDGDNFGFLLFKKRDCCVL